MEEFRKLCKRIKNVFTDGFEKEAQTLRVRNLILYCKQGLKLKDAKAEASDLAIEYFRLYDEAELKEKEDNV